MATAGPPVSRPRYSRRYAHAGAVRFVQDTRARTPCAYLREYLGRDTGGPAVAIVHVPDHEHMAVAGQRICDGFSRGVGRNDMSGRLRDLCGEDAGRRRRERRAALVHDLARQAEHRGGLAAAPDERDHLVARDAERLTQRHDSPFAAP